jgi:CDP-diglyceride synthetase
MAERIGSACSCRRRRESPLSTVLLIHDRLATTVLLFMAAVGFWGLLSYARGAALSGSMSGALVIGQILIVVQGLFGAVLFADGFRPATSIHLLYGITAAIVLPFVWSYMKDRHPRQALLFYSLVALFIAGLAVRGMTTGS